MKLHHNILYKVAHSFSGLAAEQEDLIQEITIAVWKSVPNFNGRSKASSYIYRIALNRAISWKRSKRSYTNTVNRYEDSLSGSTITGKNENERLEMLYEEIRRMDDLNRSIILLHLDGFSYQEISDSLGISISNVGVRINRIKAKLIENMGDEKL